MSDDDNSVRVMHLVDGIDPDLNVTLTIVNIGDHRGIVKIAYASGETFTLTHEMLGRINDAVQERTGGAIDPAVLGRALAEAAEARRQRWESPTRGLFESLPGS